MTTLDRYVLREWAKVFFLATFGFPLLVFVIDLADNLEKYTSGGVSTGHLALSYVYYLPETITLVLPVAVLFAVVFTVGALDRHSELTAAKASGISFHRVVRPLFAAAVVAVLADVGLTELAPVTSSRRAELLGQKQIRSDQFRNNFVYQRPGLFSASRHGGSDGQIVAYDSPNTQVYHNTVMTSGNSVYSIEVRWGTGLVFSNNLGDAPLHARDGGVYSGSNNYLSAIARLKPGVTMAQAQESMAALAASIGQANASNQDESLRLHCHDAGKRRSPPLPAGKGKRRASPY